MATSLQRAFDDFIPEATTLAGGLTDLAQRATVYHHIHRASNGNHTFPLIAAHGALWAGGYFEKRIKLARLLVWQSPFNKRLRQLRLRQLDDFANVFRDINRRVCIDVYANYHFTAKHGSDPDAAELIDPVLLDALNCLHENRRQGRSMTELEKFELFATHFLNEQDRIVGPRIEAALDEFDWALVKTLALKPTVTFKYLPKHERMKFKNFSSTDERIEHGMHAFKVASELGWQNVEDALANYNALPKAVLRTPETHFNAMRAALLLDAV